MSTESALPDNATHTVAAESLDALAEFGTIAIGKRADLILINNNPLDSVVYIQDRVGVMARGNSTSY